VFRTGSGYEMATLGLASSRLLGRWLKKKWLARVPHEAGRKLFLPEAEPVYCYCYHLMIIYS